MTCLVAHALDLRVQQVDVQYTLFNALTLLLAGSNSLSIFLKCACTFSLRLGTSKYLSIALRNGLHIL